MPGQDMIYHAILGVPHGASPAEIKRAYRRLAMRWHPDRNPEPDAAERFKEIRAAHDHLLGPWARGEAPPHAHEAGAGGSGHNAANTGNPADSGTADAGPAARAADIRLDLEISLSDAVAGCRTRVRYQRGRPCGVCSGTGESGVHRTRFCNSCHGSGRVLDAQRVLAPCVACSGRGFFRERICPACSGSGRDQAPVSLEITVPPGMAEGDELRLAGQGEPGDQDLAPGDLYLSIRIEPHPLFELRGRDVHYAMPVSALLLLAGGTLALPAPGGSIDYCLAAGSPESRRLCLAGQGLPARGRNRAGDLVVHLHPVFPQQLPEPALALLRRAHKAAMADFANTYPEIFAWHQEQRLE